MKSFLATFKECFANQPLEVVGSLSLIATGIGLSASAASGSTQALAEVYKL